MLLIGGAVAVMAATPGCSSRRSPAQESWQALALEARNRCGEGEHCTLSLGRVFPSAWERLVVFGPTLPPLGVEKTINHPLAGLEEFCTTLVFLDVDGGVLNYFQADCGDGSFDAKGPVGRIGGFVLGGQSHIVIPRAHDELSVRRSLDQIGEFFEYSYLPPAAKNAP